MDPETAECNNHVLHYDSCDPLTAVILRNPKHMVELLSTSAASQSNRSSNTFANFYILNNLKVSHVQKMILHAMLKQPTCPSIMIKLFCGLARQCYVGYESPIDNLETDCLSTGGLQVADILKWYTRQTFFYRLLNRILRAGKLSTQLFYAQHFVRNLSEAITKVHRKQRKLGQKQVRGRFKCYRGGYFSEYQIQELKQNVGKHIETLGFLSATTEQDMALCFITNTLLEIEVSDSGKDEELDRGYAYLTAEYSTKPEESEVLFNVLSSFQIKSVTRQTSYDPCQSQYCHVKLEYGVTYQMVHKYKQNKMSQQMESPEHQQVLSILGYQAMHEFYRTQEACLPKQNLTKEYVELMSKKIDLYKNTLHLPDQARLFELLLQYGLADTEQFRPNLCPSKSQSQFEGKSECQSQFLSKFGQLQQYLHQLKQPISFHLRLSVLMMMQVEVGKYFGHQKFKMCLQAADKLEKQKQLLETDISYELIVHGNPELESRMKYFQTCLKVYKSISKLKIYSQNNNSNNKNNNSSNNSNNNQQKVQEQLDNMRLLKQEVLARYGRYHHFYAALINCQLQFKERIGLGFQDYLHKKMESVIFAKGIQQGQHYDLQIQRLSNALQMSELMKNRRWAQAIRGCAALRNKYYQEREEQKKQKGGQEQDSIWFHPIFNYMNKQQVTLAQKVRILEMCSSISHPCNSGFQKKVMDSLNFIKNQQKLAQSDYIQICKKVHKLSAAKIHASLNWFQNKISAQLGEETVIWVVNQCLIANSLRMMGKYEEANLYMDRLRNRIGVKKYSQYHQLLKLSRFEQEAIRSTMTPS